MLPLEQIVLYALELYPHNFDEVSEFAKIKQMLSDLCHSSWAKNKAVKLKPSDKKKQVLRDLEQSYEYKMIINSGVSYPEIYTYDDTPVGKILNTDSAALSLSQLVDIRRSIETFVHWSKWVKNNEEFYPSLSELMQSLDENTEILETIREVLDDKNEIRDDASPSLEYIREALQQKRQQVGIVFDRELRKAKKNKQLADTHESYINQRRVLSVLAEYKRQIPGIILGESDSQKTVYLEPQATVPINNEISNLESEERTEIRKILLNYTNYLRTYTDLIKTNNRRMSVLDFIRAKAKLAIKLDATKPQYSPHAIVELHEVYHPLLKLKNEESGELTVPLDIDITQQNQIIVVSGPNAGGKTISLKTVILSQTMFQSGLLIPCDQNSKLGIFKQLFAQIGDAQSIDLKLSTYSAYLKNVKYLLDTANARTLFCIDELGAGSDPHLGGVFAEVILEELAESHAKGIVTTHYLNLKTLADRHEHMVNAAMRFDEKELKPTYKLELGKPGSSYTFSIAQRVGIEEKLIEKAKELVQDEHYQLEKLLSESEKKMQELVKRERTLDLLMEENQKSKKRYEELADAEDFKRQERLQKLQNEIKKEELENLKNLERKFKQLVQSWKKAENKNEVLSDAEDLLFNRKAAKTNERIQRKADKNFIQTKDKIEPGTLVMNVDNHQVGTVDSIEGKNARVIINRLPFTMKLDRLVAVKHRPKKTKKKPKKKA